LTGPLRSGAAGDAKKPRLNESAQGRAIPVETLKDALSAAWRVCARCIDGRVDNGRSVRKCRYHAQLDVGTLVWTRGGMPLAELSGRMKCPRCGNRRVSLIFEPPTAAGRTV